MITHTHNLCITLRLTTIDLYSVVLVSLYPTLAINIISNEFGNVRVVLVKQHEAFDYSTSLL